MSFLAGDNMYNRIMTKVFDLCLLSILTFICCIPLFTIGAALSSMYAVMMKLSKDIEGPVAASYIKEFKQNLKDSLTGSVIFVAGIFLLCFDLVMWTQNEIEDRSLFYGLTLAALVMFIAVFDWYLAVRARFFEKTLQALGNALSFSVVFLPISIINGLYTIFVIWLFMRYAVLLIFIPLIGFAVLCYPKVLLIDWKLNKYIKDKGLVPEEDDEDDWEFPEDNVLDKESDAVDVLSCEDDKVNEDTMIDDWRRMSFMDKLSYYLYNYTAGIVMGMIILCFVAGLGYHFIVHGEKCRFNLAVVNGYSDEGDAELSNVLNELFELDGKKKYAYVDTEYQMSYDIKDISVENPAADTSFYDKFFLNIRTGSMDVCIMPESFYKYCNSLGNIFYDIEYVLSKEQIDVMKDRLVTGNTEEGEYVNGIRIDDCGFLENNGIGFVETNKDESYILVFPVNGSHIVECRKFVDYIK